MFGAGRTRAAVDVRASVQSGVVVACLYSSVFIGVTCMCVDFWSLVAFGAFCCFVLLRLSPVLEGSPQTEPTFPDGAGPGRVRSVSGWTMSMLYRSSHCLL